MRALLPGQRVRPAVWLTVFAGCFLFGLAYHLTALIGGKPPAPLFRVLYHASALAGFAALWQYAMQAFRQRTAAPINAFWTLLLAGLLVSAVGGLLSAFEPAAPFRANGTPASLLTVLLMHVQVLLGAGFFFALLAWLRPLVLFKRTRRSQRNWYLMLGAMVLAGLSALGRAPGESLGWVQAIFIVPAVVFMILSAFRLSWIILLSFREKMICIGLSFALMIALPLVAAVLEDAFAVDYFDYYSYALGVFCDLALTFGVLFSVTAWLSLLFHLPTTSDIQRKADEIAAMHSLTHLVSQAFEADKLAASIAASPVEAGSAHAAWLALKGEEAAGPHVAAAHGITADRLSKIVDTGALYEAVRQTREPLLLDEAPADPRVRARSGEELDSLLAVPLIARDALLGVLFTSKAVTQGFEKDDVEAVSIFAAQAALALDHARLFEEQLEKERLARELDIARSVQQKLLPSRLPALPGLTLAAASVPAQEVGGDYYDFIALGEDRLAFIVADVSGKGTSAAFYMAEMQGIFQSASRLTRTPAEFLCHANAALHRSLEQGVFISAVYGILDARREELVLARAGHCPVAAINLHGEARFLRPQGIGLGLDRGPIFRQSLTEERVALHPGDAFVLYTDGVVETRSADGEEEYGYDRLLDALRAHRHEDAEALHEALLGDLHAFTRRAAYDDDMTLIALKWHGLGLQEAAPAHQEKAPLPRARAHAASND